MTDEENKRFIECGDDRFEIISRARKHIIEATNIEMSPKEMDVLDNFLFRCWQMGWLKNDFHQLEKENAELKESNKVERENAVTRLFQNQRLEKENKILSQRILKQQKTIGSLTDTIDELKEDLQTAISANQQWLKRDTRLEEQIEKMKCCGNCKHEQDSNTDYYCEDCKRFANETNIEKWESAE